MQAALMQSFKIPKSAKTFLLRLAPQVLDLFDVPQSILGFNTHNLIVKQIYSMSEETAKVKLDRLKELLKEW